MFKYKGHYERKEVYGRASEASSASLKRPGRNQVIDLREDSSVDIVDTLFIRNASYLAFEVAIVKIYKEKAWEALNSRTEDLVTGPSHCHISQVINWFACSLTSMACIAPPSLNFFSSSPVRGQLEPYDLRTSKGSRYIQITDTPDELKVIEHTFSCSGATNIILTLHLGSSAPAYSVHV